jgi:hypothetical protein
VADLHVQWRLRRVATRHLTIGLAHPQVHPGVSLIKTLLAARRQRLDVLDLIKVRALHRGHSTYALVRKADSFPQSRERLLLSGPLLYSDHQSPAKL